MDAGNGSEAQPIEYEALAIGAQPVVTEVDTLRLLDMLEHLGADRGHSLGLAANQERGVEHLTPILAAFLCNVSDTTPSVELQDRVALFDDCVRQYFKELTRAPRFVRTQVTANEPEAVLLGLATAVRRLQHAPVYLGDRVDHAVLAAAVELGAELVTVPTRPDGTMDAGELRRAVLSRADRGRREGAIVLATCGTVATGAVDDIEALRTAASAAGKVYVHTDATLGGMVAAHAPSEPAWSFPHGADSVSLSAHRLLGLPLPWSLTLSRTSISTSPTAGPYTTAEGLFGPRTQLALATILVWAALRRLGRAGVAAYVNRCLETAVYAQRRLSEAGAAPRRAPGSLTVTLPRPSSRLAERWHLAGSGDQVGVVCLGHVTYSAIDQFVGELEAEYDARGEVVVEPAA
ncbi:pyridoxal-dependent decarboxylase [Streptomyces sp. NPDC020681]|uniref:pyridoxal-dependent decarboxylase n=1 Tax=Streptomyces sp. NPDC020681 TaxID=3365083 RepID=UPI0037A4EE28